MQNNEQKARTAAEQRTAADSIPSASLTQSGMLADAYHRRKDFAWLLIIIANVFGFMETQYFGWNFTPQSKEEYICDGIALCINFFVLYLLLTAKRSGHGIR